MATMRLFCQITLNTGFCFTGNLFSLVSLRKRELEARFVVRREHRVAVLLYVWCEFFVGDRCQLVHPTCKSGSAAERRHRCRCATWSPPVADPRINQAPRSRREMSQRNSTINFNDDFPSIFGYQLSTVGRRPPKSCRLGDAGDRLPRSLRHRH